MTDLRDMLQSTLGTAYTLERELGGGGMSRVFLATETAFERSVVVKLLPPELTGGVNIDRFRREMMLAARLQHPHIVPVLAAGEMNGAPYYTMPYVEGRSLRAQLEEQGPLDVGTVVEILGDVAKALAYAHEHGVVHRDIKPDNVLISGGAAVVTDFGIAKALSDARLPASGAALTQIGMSMGTPAYMAPEQAAADPATDHRADLYSFGCLAYELLTGRPPFVEPSLQKLLAAQMSDRPAAVRTLRHDAPAPLCALVMRCLAKDAADRPQHAAEMLRVLDGVPTPAATLRSRAILVKMLGVFAAAIAAGLVLRSCV